MALGRMSRIIKDMEKLNLVRRQKTEARRGMLVTVTENGRDIWQRAKGRRNELNARRW